ncbi:hypothetical protein [Komagataeibacter oboediens]|uniref:Uncharacterized protein n=1 Tax=Komagataeibacter oboediens TaxID=65958 RepID=A0ABS5SR06_9PROT|nr:hypothetical protein [Komagataeibacter oboediens]MBL7233366.1 hypothetical protein [Komagataeibacter oboediens]MBT0676668.1 hypothetical protein [Komagataeibacter oboediens]MBT0678193.1 hypothetical protein [Komagataeibacter oboediens]
MKSPRQRQRPGKHARVLMTDRRWRLLGLSARAMWLELTDAADLMPELRAPVHTAPDLEQFTRLVAANAAEVTTAIEQLVQLDILEAFRNGYRLKAY